jgi:hypothetical protein
MPHPPRRLGNQEYRHAQEALPIACTDTYLYDAANDSIFLGSRVTEPQISPWPIGGRGEYDQSLQDSAAAHVSHDFGVTLRAGRFDLIGDYSTPFPVAGSGEANKGSGRHTINSIFMVSLSPEEVAAVNAKVASGDISPENSGGQWTPISKILERDTDYPNAVKQAAFDLHNFQRLRELDLYGGKGALQEAYEEKDRREKEGWLPKEEVNYKAKRLKVEDQLTQLGIVGTNAELLLRGTGNFAVEAVGWYLHALDAIGHGNARDADPGILKQ